MKIYGQNRSNEDLSRMVMKLKKRKKKNLEIRSYRSRSKNAIKAEAKGVKSMMLYKNFYKQFCKSSPLVHHNAQLRIEMQRQN